MTLAQEIYIRLVVASAVAAPGYPTPAKLAELWTFAQLAAATTVEPAK